MCVGGVLEERRERRTTREAGGGRLWWRGRRLRGGGCFCGVHCSSPRSVNGLVKRGAVARRRRAVLGVDRGPILGLRLITGCLLLLRWAVSRLDASPRRAVLEEEVLRLEVAVHLFTAWRRVKSRVCVARASGSPSRHKAQGRCSRGARRATSSYSLPAPGYSLPATLPRLTSRRGISARNLSGISATSRHAERVAVRHDLGGGGEGGQMRRPCDLHTALAKGQRPPPPFPRLHIISRSRDLQEAGPAALKVQQPARRTRLGAHAEESGRRGEQWECAVRDARPRRCRGWWPPRQPRSRFPWRGCGRRARRRCTPGRG